MIKIERQGVSGVLLKDVKAGHVFRFKSTGAVGYMVDNNNYIFLQMARDHDGTLGISNDIFSTQCHSAALDEVEDLGMLVSVDQITVA